MAKVGPSVLVWTILCTLALLTVELAWFGAVARTVRLPHLESPLPQVGFLGIVLGAPIAEEVLFRGYGLSRIRELGGEGRALLFTALVFAFAHMHWVKLPGTFALGLFLGWLVLRTGSLWPALLGHFTINASAVVLSLLVPGEHPDLNYSWGRILAFGATGLACFVLLWSPRVRGRIRALAAST
jgi:membrane protease YdiL (CAAX protease family)